MYSNELKLKQARLLAVENLPDVDVAILESSGAGAFTARIDGRWLHSKHDPIKEARRQQEKIRPAKSTQLLILFGSGLGYLVQMLLEVLVNPIVLIEPRLDILALMLGLHDYHSYLESGRLKILSGVVQDEQWQEIARGRQNTDILFISHRASYQLDNSYANLQITFENFLNKKSVNLATLSRFDRLWARNLIRNFSVLYKTRPVQRLFQSVPGGAAIVCGAGPSLDADIEALRSLRPGRLLIAVDTALHILQTHGLQPDIVVSVDPQALNQYYLEGYTGEAFFVVDPTTSYLSLRHIPPNKLFYMASPFALARILSDQLGEQVGEVAFGGSVSTNAYDLAIQMGCKEIILFGQDFSFPGKRAHAAGALLEDRLNYKEERLFRRELHNYRQMSALPVRHLSDKHGMAVPTNDKLIIFYRWFEARFAIDRGNGIQIYDCKSAGAHFEGVMSEVPAKIVNHIASQHADEAGQYFNLASKVDLRPPELNAEGFVESLHSIAGDFAELSFLARDALKIASRTLQAVKSDAKNRAYFEDLRRLDALDQKLKSRQSCMQIVGGAMQKVIFQLTEGFGDQLSVLELQDPHLQAAREAQLLYAGIHSAAEEHAQWLQKVLRIIERNVCANEP